MFEAEEKTITLRKPVTLGSGEASITYTELKLREPTAGEMEKASRADTQNGVVIDLIKQVAKVPRTVAENLCQRDFVEASQYFAGFFAPGDEAAGQS